MARTEILRLMNVAICILLGHSCLMAQPAGSPIDTAFLMTVNGVEQYLEIKGVSRSKPVLLFIHGGPSWPATPMLRRYNQDLAKDFVLVSWDQRNCGKSKTEPSVKLTPELFVEDAHQVTQFLKEKFNVKKILVVGNSWGSIIGVLLVTRYADDYLAYVGVGQVVNQARTLVVARDFVLQNAGMRNDTSTVTAVMRMNISNENAYQFSFEEHLHFYQLAGPYIKSERVTTLEDPTQLYPDYHYTKIDWFTPLMTYGKELLNYMNSIRLDLTVYDEFKLPIYFVAGRFDYNSPSTVVAEYFKAIKAPLKKIFWFEQSGHSPQWEEPKRFHECLVEIRNDTMNR